MVAFSQCLCAKMCHLVKLQKTETERKTAKRKVFFPFPFPLTPFSSIKTGERRVRTTPRRKSEKDKNFFSFPFLPSFLLSWSFLGSWGERHCLRKKRKLKIAGGGGRIKRRKEGGMIRPELFLSFFRCLLLLLFLPFFSIIFLRVWEKAGCKIIPFFFYTFPPLSPSLDIADSPGHLAVGGRCLLFLLLPFLLFGAGDRNDPTSRG